MSGTIEKPRAPRSAVRRAFFAFLPALAYMGLISWLSALPLSLPLSGIPLRDKLVHAIEYGLLGLLSARAMRVGFPALRPRQALITAAVITALFGYFDELHQAFVPGRDASLMDLAADAVGAALGVLAYAMLERRRVRARSIASGAAESRP